jgi:hypothetical protein
VASSRQYVLGRMIRSPVSRSTNSAALGRRRSIVRNASQPVSTASCRSLRSSGADVAEAGLVEYGGHPYCRGWLTGQLDEPRVLHVEDPLRIAGAVPGLAASEIRPTKAAPSAFFPGQLLRLAPDAR